VNVKLSIVFGTYNRYDMVVELIESIRQRVETPYEIVIADGGSTDGTREWLVEQPDVVIIGERSLNGAVDAYNKAFSIAAGEFVAHLNDDCLLVDDSLDAACARTTSICVAKTISMQTSVLSDAPLVNLSAGGETTCTRMVEIANLV